MNYGEIERQTFRTFLAFSTLLVALILVFFNITSDLYRISDIDYDDKLELNMYSVESLMGTSIWLIDDTYFISFYEENPTVEKISIQKRLPNKLIVQIDISDEIAYIQDNRQSPPRMFVLHKNLYTLDKRKIKSINPNRGAGGADWESGATVANTDLFWAHFRPLLAHFWLICGGAFRHCTTD